MTTNRSLAFVAGLLMACVPLFLGCAASIAAAQLVKVEVVEAGSQEPVVGARVSLRRAIDDGDDAYAASADEVEEANRDLFAEVRRTTDENGQAVLAVHNRFGWAGIPDIVIRPCSPASCRVCKTGSPGSC